MPQGDKSSYTDKQKRQAAHIEDGYEKKGVGVKAAEARAWARKVLDKEPTMPRYLRRRERPWFRRARKTLKQLPA